MHLLLTAAQVGRMLQVSPRTLETWRREGRGPNVWMLGRLVRYRAADVHAWVDEMPSRAPAGYTTHATSTEASNV